MTRPSPAEYVRQVRQEMAKVTWPNRKETAMTTVTVLFMVFLAALFFLAVDSVISYLVKLLLGIGA